MRGTLGSSVQFNWTFSGDVYHVTWGLTRAADSTAFDNNQKLYLLTKSGQGSGTPPSAYTGRVSGHRSGNNVTFTLNNLRKGDTRFYGCKVSPQDPNLDPKFDNVKLFVEGEYGNLKFMKQKIQPCQEMLLCYYEKVTKPYRVC